MCMHNRLPAPLRALAAIVFCGASLAAATTGSISVKHVQVDDRYDKMFLPQKRGFLGADGAASVPLSDRRILWIFGDTVLGVQKNGKREGPMIRNSIALTDHSTPTPKVTYWWDLADRLPGDPFRPAAADDPNWIWPGCGIFVGGKAYLFLTNIGRGPGEESFAFSTLGCTLFTIQNPNDAPEKWKVTQTPFIAANDHFNVNSAAFVEGDYVYLVGYDDGVTSRPAARSAILSRLRVSELSSAEPGNSLEFLSDDDSWNKSPRRLKTLFKPGPTETGVHYDPTRKRYFAATIKPFSSQLLLTSAEKITGPWSEPQPVYEIPQVNEAKKLHAYTTRIHPALSTGADELVISYVVNSTDFWSMFTQMDIYYPRFIRVTLDAPAAGAK